MNSLGYINIFWLHEFITGVIWTSDLWFVKKYPDKTDFEADGYLLFLVNNRSLSLFIEHGLKPDFENMNDFQKRLVLDTIALLIAKDESHLWTMVNYYDGMMGDGIIISDDPKTLFTEFFDILSIGYHHQLAEYSTFSDYRYDQNDKIILYQYC